MIIRILNIVSLILLSVTAFSKTLEVELPYYAGRDYYFCLWQGANQDTVATGRLNYQGKASINLPKDYRGVGCFTVREFGKLRNVVIHGNEHIIMYEADSMHAETVFSNSVENSFLLDALARQNRIITEYNEALNGTQSQALIFSLPEQRLLGLESEYVAFRKDINESTLYAARLVEILNCLSGVGSSFDVSQEELVQEQLDFIVNKLNFRDLYTSGFWAHIFEIWFLLSSEDDSLLLEGIHTLLDRCDDMEVRHEMAQTIIRKLTQQGRDHILAELGSDVFSMPLNGQLAPEIVVGDASFLPKNSLILFYETGCGSCHKELHELNERYKLLADNNIRIISIAADVDKNVYKETTKCLHWVDKLCDFRGFNSPNFRNYGIIGTPTYILTDKDGIIRGRYAQIKELIK